MAFASLGQRQIVQEAGTAQPLTVPSPVGGLNTIDPEDAMPPQDALQLDNFFPDIGSVVLRAGFTSHATNVGSGDVETIAEFNDGDTRKMISAGGVNLYDSTAAGSATNLASGFSNARWQSEMFAGKLGLVNGADAPQTYNGSAVSAMTVSAAASGASITAADLVGIIAYKSRTYFWSASGGTNNPARFWYSAVESLGGGLTEFPLDLLASGGGGKIVTMGKWSRDSGDGVDDMLAMFMSSGKVFLYSGSDPGSDFALVGEYETGAPLGVRAVGNIGGELVIMTRTGFVTMTEILTGVLPSASRLRKLNGIARDEAANHGSQFGWQMIEHPDGSIIYFNVPIVDSSEYQQLILNPVTNAPCRFTDMNARCWGKYNDNIYFGAGSGTIFEADTGRNDNGENIIGIARAAYSRPTPGLNVQATGIKPVLIASGTLNYSINAEFDFEDLNLESGMYELTPQGLGDSLAGDPTPIEDISTPNIEDWDQELSDRGAAINQWLSATGIGGAIGNKSIVQTQESVEWFSTMTALKPAGAV